MKMDGREIAKSMLAKRNLDSVDNEDKEVVHEESEGEASLMPHFINAVHEKDAEGAHKHLTHMVQGMMSKKKERKEEADEEAEGEREEKRG